VSFFNLVSGSGSGFLCFIVAGFVFVVVVVVVVSKF
jgi:hypothetical protein